MTRRVLMIAYHFPPLTGGSGLQRTLRFAQHLPAEGWEPIVIAPQTRAYPQVASDLLSEISSEVRIERAFALDAARHLAIFGRYPRALALPDRWVSWWLGAVPLGLKLIRRHRPQAIWSTCPIATAHLIGATLQRLSGLPWVADMRDPLVQDTHPSDWRVRRAYAALERRMVDRASRVVFVTPGLARHYQAHYPSLDAARVRVIENGFDEDSFARLEAAKRMPVPVEDAFVLVHSGLVYPTARDPRALFLALRRIADSGILDSLHFKVVFRASGRDTEIAALADELGVSRWISLAPAVGYVEALSEMCGVHGLLLMQSAMCNDQIPAKTYEYLRAGRPILALTDERGDTGRLLRSFGIDSIAPLDDARAIAVVLTRFIERVRSGEAPIAPCEHLMKYSRQRLTRSLAQVLDDVAAQDAA